jgi:hypothetical protein
MGSKTISEMPSLAGTFHSFGSFVDDLFKLVNIYSDAPFAAAA